MVKTWTLGLGDLVITVTERRIVSVPQEVYHSPRLICFRFLPHQTRGRPVALDSSHMIRQQLYELKYMETEAIYSGTIQSRLTTCCVRVIYRIFWHSWGALPHPSPTKYPFRVTPHFQAHKQMKQMVCLKHFLTPKNGGLQPALISTQNNNGCQCYDFLFIKNIVSVKLEL